MNLPVGTIKAQVNDPNVRVGYLCLFTYNAYSNQQKLFSGIPEDIIAKYGVYSLECAKAMAMAMTGQKNTQADFSPVSQTGRDRQRTEMFSLKNTLASTASLLLNFEGVATTVSTAVAFIEAIGNGYRWQYY